MFRLTNVICFFIFLNISTSVLIPLHRLKRKSELCKEDIFSLMSWCILPGARNFKPLIEFQTSPAKNYPAGTSYLITLAPTRIYVGIVHNLDIVLLAKNCPTGTSELQILHYVENFPLACNIGST